MAAGIGKALTIGLFAASATATAPSVADERPAELPNVGIPSPRAPPPPPPQPSRECHIGPEGQEICLVRPPLSQGIGGSRVERGSAPWQAQIYSMTFRYTAAEIRAVPEWERRHRCGGSLIAEGWVLTAAHCIEQKNIDDGYRVRLGAEDLSTGEGATYRIARMVRHADYSAVTKLHEIALLRIVADAGTRPLSPGKVRTIALDAPPKPGPLRSGDTVFATGWGKTAPGPDGRPSAVLIEIEVETVPQDQCAAAPGYGDRIRETVLCAASPGIDTCTGDSGGPLVLYPRTVIDKGSYRLNGRGAPILVGIVSWGKGCAEVSSPGVYTRVAHYRDWIRRAMAAPPGANSLR